MGTLTLERGAADRSKIGDSELGDVDTSGTGGGAIFIRGGQFVGQGRSLISPIPPATGTDAKSTWTSIVFC